MMNLSSLPFSRRFVVAVLGLACCLLAQRTTPAETEIYRDVLFASPDGHDLHLDLYLPEGVDQPPLIVWIHGGGWRGGSKDRVFVKDLLDHGFAIASVEYRLTQKAIFPAQIHDCKAAVRWLKAHATQYGYDKGRFGVAGSSAGGHLALLVGTSGGVQELEGTVGVHLDESSTVQAIVDFYGPSDFVLRGKTQPDRAYTEKSGSFALLGGLLHGKIEEATERTASPTHYVSEDDPPLLVLHGTDDQTVLLDQSERIVECYQEAGLSAELLVIEGGGHGGEGLSTPATQNRIKAFLEEHLQSRSAGPFDRHQGK